MFSINFIVHIFAGASFFALIYFLVNIQKQSELLRKLIKQKNPHPIFFTNPDKVVKKLCQSLSIPFYTEGKKNRSNLKRLQIHSMFNLLTDNSAREVCYKYPTENFPYDRIEVKIKNRILNSLELEKKISKELKLTVHIIMP